MNQQVEITLKLTLRLDAAMDEDEIVTHVRSSLPKAFGEELTSIENPVDILELMQEAEIYGETNSQRGDLNAPWTLHFDRDGTEDVAVICDAEGSDIATSRPFWRPEGDDPTPPTLIAMRAMKAAPKLLATIRCALADLQGSKQAMEQGDINSHNWKAHQLSIEEAQVAIAEATDDSIGRVS